LRLPSKEWLPLLRRLTEASDRWGVLKNADRSLAGKGDMDIVAPASEHPILAEVFEKWASEEGLRWMVVCPHPGGILVLVAIDRTVWAQLDLVKEMPLRGARLFSAEDLLPLMVMDGRGFRRLRTGAEGFLLFLYKGIRRGGRFDVENLERYEILEKLAEDWDGVEQSSHLLGSARRPILRVLRSALERDWNTRAWLEAEAFMAIRALRHPSILASRVFIRSWRLPRCQVTRTVSAGRQPGDLQAWLALVDRNHEVRVIPEGGSRTG
jgi:hypothetical protein